MTVIAASGIATALPLLLVIACPLAMVFMMRGMHGGHGHDQQEAKSREQMTMDELKHAGDELNDEIGQRASR